MKPIETEVEKFLDDNNSDFHHFHKHTKESNFRKTLSNKWDIVANWSINLGNSHFAVTINMPIELDFDNVTSLYNYDDFEIEWYTKIENKIKDLVFNNFKSATFCFIVSEKNKSGILHFHCLIGIRNFIDYNYTIKNNLILLFREFSDTDYFNHSDMDIKVESLKTFKDLKNWAIYMYKDMYNWKWYSIFYILDKYKQNPIINNLGDVTWFFLQINWKIESINNNKIPDLEGIKLTYNVLNQRTIVNILQYYLILNEYYIYNDSIYKKINNTKISYKLVGTLTEILYNNFQENVISFFIINYYYNFNNFDFNYLITTFFIKSKSVIESLKDLITNKITLDFSILEFNDGIYYIKYNRFVPIEDAKNLNITQATIKYYNKSYNWIRQNKPSVWLKGLNHALDVKVDEKIENNIEFNKIYNSFANIFQKDNIKQSVLFTFGESSTGKTALIAKPIINFFGKDNIGLIVSSKSFKWQELCDKEVGIIDEGRYNSSISSDLFKIMGQENIIVEKKYSKEHVQINPIPLFIISNNLFEDKNKKLNQSLFNRMKTVEFINVVSNYDLETQKDFKKDIKEEEANIIVYCNKLYFKSLKKTKIKLKFNKDFKKLIEVSKKSEDFPQQ